MRAHKILNIPSPDITLQNKLSKELDISRVLAQILINRGITTPEEAGEFLNPDLKYLLDPYSFSQMRRAVALIKQAAQNRDRVMVFGDYDVDGLTSLALLKEAFSKIGLDVVHCLPHRTKDGYGLTRNIRCIAQEQKVKLLVTVDCGISNNEQVKELRRHDIDVIVTDHHEPAQGGLPPASAIINPKVPNSGYKYRDLAGVGVAYKLCQALSGRRSFEELDLVSLGTISDVVPLLGENRIIVKHGLARLSQTKRVGLRALIEEAGVKDRKMTSTFVSYMLGPRLNASGRMDTAEVSFDLLMSQDQAEAEGLAKIIGMHNRQRQKIENKILEEAQELIDKEVNFKEHKVIVIAKDDWHQGVLGIVASKLADRFFRPAIVISLTRDLCKGSGRSIKNFHLLHALMKCKDLLHAFGGHSHAAGLVITRENIKDFKDSINRLAGEQLCLEDLLPSLEIDMELPLSGLDRDLVRELEVLEPFGTGNPEPLFYSRNLKLKSAVRVMGRDTLKFWVTDGGSAQEVIGFRMANFKASLCNSEYFDLVYSPRLDNWQGESNIILEAKDIFFR